MDHAAPVPVSSVVTLTTVSVAPVGIPLSPPIAYRKRAARVAKLPRRTGARRAVGSAVPIFGGDRFPDDPDTASAEKSPYVRSSPLVTRMVHSDGGVSDPTGGLLIVIEVAFDALTVAGNVIVAPLARLVMQ